MERHMDMFLSTPVVSDGLMPAASHAAARLLSFCVHRHAGRALAVRMRVLRADTVGVQCGLRWRVAT